MTSWNEMSNTTSPEVDDIMNRASGWLSLLW